MALPDLPTSEIGLIGFWNAFDEGTSTSANDEVDPSKMTDHDRLVEIEHDEDNGWQGRIDAQGYANKTREMYWRVKTDGWIMVWYPRDNETGVEQNTPPDCYLDLLNDWTQSRSQTNLLPDSMFSVEIAEIASHVVLPDLVGPSQTGYYSFEFTDADAIWQGTHKGPDGSRERSRLLYTSDIERKYHFVGGSVHHNDQNADSAFEGHLLADENSAGNGRQAGVIDVLTGDPVAGSGLMPSAGVTAENAVHDASLDHLTMFRLL